MGRALVLFLVLATALAGGGAYYLQVYAYYDRLPAQDNFVLDGVDVPVANFQGIDSDSSPIRYRACFDIDVDAAGLTAYDRPTPLIAPGWFSCFDAGALTAALADGRAVAVMGTPNIRYGIDRVVALWDGRGYAWHQINPCGEAHFNRDPVPPFCPEPPAR